MIFITLGSQKFQFNRLLKAVDEQIESEKITDTVFAQTGASDYIPRHYSYKNFLDRNEFANTMSSADIVITHGGTGAIIGAVKKGKKVIAVPRLAIYGEHVDNHQTQIIGQFRELNLIYECDDCNRLYKDIDKIKDINFSIYESNTENIIRRIEGFIKENIKESYG